MLFHIATLFFGRAGGGGHGGGGGGGFGGGSGGGAYGSSSGGNASVIVFLILMAIVIFVSMRSRARANKAQPGAAWPSAEAEQQVRDIFYAFQRDWAANNPTAMQAYLSPSYFYNVNLMLLALTAVGRRNTMEDVTLRSVEPLTNPQTATQAAGATLVVRMHAQAKDSLVEQSSGTVYYTDTSPFSEDWYFMQDGNTWRLDAIRQTTEAENDLSPAIQSFAATNNYFYSGEWGWLLLPQRGQLFSKASFTNSAVNNHVIGLYKNCIIEFYSYLPNRNGSESYTIAQAFLPKHYEDILVRRKGIVNLTPRGLRQVTMEWPDFNKKYDVYATSVEQVTSFELLNPSFMEQVKALPFTLNIEVVDNVVYLYTNQTLADYTQMRDILYRAFQEMKL